MNLICKSCLLPALAVAVLLATQLACTQATPPTQTSAACKAGDYSVAQYRSLNPAQQTQLVENCRKQYSPALEKVQGTLKDAHPDPPFRVLGRLKTVDSIQEKISRKKYTFISELTDIAGARIIIPSYAALPNKRAHRQPVRPFIPTYIPCLTGTRLWQKFGVKEQLDFGESFQHQ